ncbi:MAG: hypothetical protein AB7V10_04570, partial [Leucobacter sp.]
MKRLIGAGILGSALALGSIVAAPATAQAAPLPAGCDLLGQCELVFDYTGAVESWTVPAGATQIDFEVRGGSGYGHWNRGGLGGSFTTRPADIAPGTAFAIAVGQGGQGTLGGWGGGGDGGPLGNPALYEGM